MDIDWQTIFLTIKLATTTVIILLIIGTPLAWWLAKSKWFFKDIIASIVALPIVLPPTVLGFYLLLILGPEGFIGKLTSSLGIGTLPFTFAGLVFGSVIYSLPFVVQPIKNSFESIGQRPLEVAATLRIPPLQSFIQIALPLARPGLITGAILGFAHTVGEFGVILMIGGNIPGETKVLSVAIYDHVESMEWNQAHILSAGMLIFSFIVVYSMYKLEKKLAGNQA